MPPFPGPPVPTFPVLNANGAMPVQITAAPGSAVKNITTEAGTLVHTGPGTFQGFNVNSKGTASTLEVVDGINGSGTVLGTFDTTVAGANYPPGGWPFTVGLFIVTQGSAPADVTVSYAPAS